MIQDRVGRVLFVNAEQSFALFLLALASAACISYNTSHLEIKQNSGKQPLPTINSAEDYFVYKLKRLQRGIYPYKKNSVLRIRDILVRIRTSDKRIRKLYIQYHQQAMQVCTLNINVSAVGKKFLG